MRVDLRADEQHRVVDLECEVLRALCQTHPTEQTMQAAIAVLGGYPWRHSEHRVVFEAFAKIHSTEALPLRERLAAETTRMGFPDIDWALYFDAAPKTQRLEQLLRNLKELAGSP